MARSRWRGVAFLLVGLMVSFSIFTGVSAYLVDDEKVEQCAREVGKAKHKCCFQILNECVAACSNDLECRGYCYAMHEACLVRQPAD